MIALKKRIGFIWIPSARYYRRRGALRKVETFLSLLGAGTTSSDGLFPVAKAAISTERGQGPSAAAAKMILHFTVCIVAMRNDRFCGPLPYVPSAAAHRRLNRVDRLFSAPHLSFPISHSNGQWTMDNAKCKMTGLRMDCREPDGNAAQFGD